MENQEVHPDASGNGELPDHYTEWLNEERQCWASYEHRKETAAWLATALALGGAAFSLTASPVESAQSTLIAVGASVGLALLYGAILSFINMQFRCRWIAADYTAGIMRARAMHLAGFPPKLKVVECITDEQNQAPEEAYHVWPESVFDAINAVRSIRPWEERWSDDRFTTEFASYATLAVAFVAVFARIWHWTLLAGVIALLAVIIANSCVIKSDPRKDSIKKAECLEDCES